MISNGSLAAFSAAALSSVPPSSAQRPVQQAAARAQTQPGNGGAPRTPLQAAPGQTPPSSNLPRGSLLDLSV